MKSIIYAILLIVATPALTALFFYREFAIETDRVFLTISTFIFSIFTGFFISRQASRFNRIRETVTGFDGCVSSVYRAAGHISKKLQVDMGRVISAHYNRVFETGKWNIHLIEKSTTLSDLHNLLDKHVVEDEVSKLANQALGAIAKNLTGCQAARKQLVALAEERIPREQWIMIIFFMSILIVTVSTVPSTGLLFASLLKAAFIVSVLSVLYILYKLNNLAYTERLMGERSAQDVLAIIEGSK